MYMHYFSHVGKETKMKVQMYIVVFLSYFSELKF